MKYNKTTNGLDLGDVDCQHDAQNIYIDNCQNLPPNTDFAKAMYVNFSTISNRKRNYKSLKIVSNLPQCPYCRTTYTKTHTCNAARISYMNRQIASTDIGNQELQPSSFDSMFGSALRRKNKSFLIFYDLENLSSESGEMLYVILIGLKIYYFDGKLANVVSKNEITDISKLFFEYLQNRKLNNKIDERISVNFRNGIVFLDDFDAADFSQYYVLMNTIESLLDFLDLNFEDVKLINLIFFAYNGSGFDFIPFFKICSLMMPEDQDFYYDLGFIKRKLIKTRLEVGRYQLYLKDPFLLLPWGSMSLDKVYKKVSGKTKGKLDFNHLEMSHELMRLKLNNKNKSRYRSKILEYCDQDVIMLVDIVFYILDFWNQNLQKHEWLKTSAILKKPFNVFQFATVPQLACDQLISSLCKPQNQGIFSLFLDQQEEFFRKSLTGGQVSSNMIGMATGSVRSFDINSLYPTCFTGPVGCGPIQEIDVTYLYKYQGLTSIEIYNKMNIDHFFIECKIYKKTNKHFLLCSEHVTFPPFVNQGKKLASSFEGEVGYFSNVSLATCMHQDWKIDYSYKGFGYRFTEETTIHREIIDKCRDLKETDEENSKALGKLIMNSMIGKLIQRKEYNSVIGDSEGEYAVGGLRATKRLEQSSKKLVSPSIICLHRSYQLMVIDIFETLRKLGVAILYGDTDSFIVAAKYGKIVEDLFKGKLGSNLVGDIQYSPGKYYKYNFYLKEEESGHCFVVLGRKTYCIVGPVNKIRAKGQNVSQLTPKDFFDVVLGGEYESERFSVKKILENIDPQLSLTLYGTKLKRKMRISYIPGMVFCSICNRFTYK